jgi:3'(2'), 5'-bisphosphate nucleotidase
VPAAAEAQLLQAVIELAREAAAIVMAIYARGFAVQGKADRSPVTEADVAAERHIVRGLRELTPQLAVVAEEEVAAGASPAVGERFWLVDPLDGTREFVARNGEFSVNIGLVERGEPLLGAVAVPASGLIYAGQRGAGAFVQEGRRRRPIACRERPAAGATVLASRSHRDEQRLARYLATERVAQVQRLGSSWKFARIAEGAADLYPRHGRTMEWDTAAGHALLAAAGGQVLDMSGIPLTYGKPGFENPDFVARAR